MLDGLREIFRQAHRSSGKHIYRCPVCGSRNIHPLHNLGWIMPTQYYCEDCGYIGYIVIEDIEEKPKIADE